MSTKIGTVANYLELLDVLDDFLTAAGHAWGKSFVGAGTGDLVNYTGTASSVAETFTLTATSATTFSVVGSVSGALAPVTVGAPYSNAKIALTISNGSTPFSVGDKFYISTSPKWSRLRAVGCAGQDKRPSDMSGSEKLFDGDSDTRATKPAPNGYVDFEMARPTEVREFVLQAYTATDRSPRDFRLQYRDSAGDAWTTAQSWTAQTWANIFEAKTFTLSSAPGAHRFWRFEILAVNGAQTIDVANLTLREKVADAFSLCPRAEFAWRGPGLDGTKQIHVGCETYGSSDADTWNLGFSGFRAWDPSRSISGQPNGTTSRFLSLVNSPIGYWIVANGQRFIVVTKAAGVYQVAYCGFGLPYEPPSVHAYPEIIGASSAIRATRYGSQSPYFQHPMDPGDNASSATAGLVAFYPDAQWRSHSNRSTYSSSTGTEGVFAQNWGQPGHVWPAALSRDSDARPAFVRENLDATRPLLPGVISFNSDPSHTWGEFDGYYWTTGFGAVAEAIIREAGFDHLVVNNIFRTGVQHYAAVRLD